MKYFHTTTAMLALLFIGCVPATVEPLADPSVEEAPADLLMEEPVVEEFE
jgi:hypothetical protein